MVVVEKPVNTRSLLLEIDRVLRIVVIVALLLSAPGVSLTLRVASAEARAGSGTSPIPVASATTLLSPLATPAVTALPVPAAGDAYSSCDTNSCQQ